MFDLIFSTSRGGAEDFSWPDPFAIISITDPDSRPVSFRHRNLTALCGLEFWDLLRPPGDDRVTFDSQGANGPDFRRAKVRQGEVAARSL